MVRASVLALVVNVSVISIIYVTRSGKSGLICTSTEIHFLSVHESNTHALPRNTKYLTINGQICFHIRG